MAYGELKSSKVERLKRETGLKIHQATTKGMGNHHILLCLEGGNCVEYDPKTKTWKHSEWKWSL